MNSIMIALFLRKSIPQERAIVTPENLTILLRRKPFHPFRVHMMDGSSHDIHQPEIAVTTRYVLFLGKVNSRGTGSFGLAHQLSLSQIVRIERLDEPEVEPDLILTVGPKD